MGQLKWLSSCSTRIRRFCSTWSTTVHVSRFLVTRVWPWLQSIVAEVNLSGTCTGVPFIAHPPPKMGSSDCSLPTCKTRILIAKGTNWPPPTPPHCSRVVTTLRSVFLFHFSFIGRWPPSITVNSQGHYTQPKITTCTLSQRLLHSAKDHYTQPKITIHSQGSLYSAKDHYTQPRITILSQGSLYTAKDLSQDHTQQKKK